MPTSAAIVFILLASSGFACWIIFVVLKAIWDGAKSRVDAMLKDIKANRKRRHEEKLGPR